MIEISENTTDVQIYITANKIYKLFVDGEQVGEGPLRSGKHYWAYDRYSLTERMTPGVHTIAVIVHL